MFKSVFLVNTLHARTRVWAISLPVLYINVLYIVPRPSWHWNEYFSVSITVGWLLFGIIPRANKS